MSIEAINWAFPQAVTPTQKLVLLVLANCANTQRVAFPSTAYLMQQTGLSERAVRKAKRDLIETGLIYQRSGYGRNDVFLNLDYSASETAPPAPQPAPRAGKRHHMPGTCHEVHDEKEPAPRAAKTAPPAPQPAPRAPHKNHHITITEPLPPVSPSAGLTSKPPDRGKSPLPDWLPVDAWEGWMEMRRMRHKPPTKRAIELTLAKLTKLREQGHDPRECLDESTQNGWTGVFPPKPDWNRPRRSQADKNREDLAQLGREIYEQEQAEKCQSWLTCE